MVMVMVCVLINALIEFQKKEGEIGRSQKTGGILIETLAQKFKQVTSQALQLRKKLCLSGLRRVKPRLLNNNRSIIMHNTRDKE